MKKHSGAERKRIMSEVIPEKAFWINNGPVVHSLKELASVIQTLTPQQFAHHVTKERNDFAKWIQDVIGDRHLAKRVKSLKNKDAVAGVVTEHIESLSKHG
jgi:hypothetical protein